MLRTQFAHHTALARSDNAQSLELTSHKLASAQEFQEAAIQALHVTSEEAGHSRRAPLQLGTWISTLLGVGCATQSQGGESSTGVDAPEE